MRSIVHCSRITIIVIIIINKHKHCGYAQTVASRALWKYLPEGPNEVDCTVWTVARRLSGCVSGACVARRQRACGGVGVGLGCHGLAGVWESQKFYVLQFQPPIGHSCSTVAVTTNWYMSMLRASLASHQRTPPVVSSQYRSLEQLTVYNVIIINKLICLMIYILKHRAQHLLVWNNALPVIRKPPHNRRLSRTCSDHWAL
jgi:hypothetical protein